MNEYNLQVRSTRSFTITPALLIITPLPSADQNGQLIGAPVLYIHVHCRNPALNCDRGFEVTPALLSLLPRVH